MELAYSHEQLQQATIELVHTNDAKHCHIRPLVFRGYGDAGVDGIRTPIEVYLLAWKWGKYPGDEALKDGVDVCRSSWNRMAPNTLPAMAKAAANYMHSPL